MLPNMARTLSLIPDPTSLYLTSSMQLALVKVGYLVAKHQGLALIYGAEGTGKTSLLRYIYARYGAGSHPAVFLTVEGELAERSFVMVNEIAKAFNVAPRRSQAKLLVHMEPEFLALAKKGHTPLLFIDDAHLLSSEHLQVVETLLRLRYRGRRIVQAVLAGDLTLPERVTEFTSLPIAAHVALDSLTFGEVKAMLDHKAKLSGIEISLTPTEIEKLFAQSGGIPAKALRLASSVAA